MQSFNTPSPSSLLTVGLLALMAVSPFWTSALPAQAPQLGGPAPECAAAANGARMAPLAMLRSVSDAKGISSPDPAAKACVIMTMSCNSTVVSELTTDDCTIDDGTYIDFWEFQGADGQTVTIDLMSDDFDTYLFLIDPTPDTVAVDDDGGDVSNSRIVYTLDSSGTWTIGANAFFLGDTGEYTLSLSCGGVQISEIRTDQPDADDDEYFELAGDPGASLDGLTYLVIGDTPAGGSGVIEEVTNLTGQTIPANGFFVAAESTFTLGTPDLTTTLDFENDDNVTHLLVDGFTGSIGQDLDTDDDGTLDTTPWAGILDLIAVILEENPPTGTEWHYGPPTVGPNGTEAPQHVYRCFDGWTIGESVVGIDDTPGSGALCLTYYGTVDLTDLATARQSIHDVIDDHTRTPISSPDSWLILEAADEDPSNPGNILDVYKNASYAKVGGGTGPYNREHTWPDSYGFPVDSGTGRYPGSDYHGIFLCDAGYNSSRSNLPFDYCPSCSELETDANNGQGGTSTGDYPGDSNWRTGSGPTGSWETWTGDLGGRRGDVARAVLYMDVRYDGSDHSDGSEEPDLILTDDRDLIVSDNTNPQDPAYMGILSTLLAWHDQDPPDDVERARNEVVAAAQGNRNPFIDHPEWVACLWVEPCGIFADGFESGDVSAWSSSVP